jgi:amidase
MDTRRHDKVNPATEPIWVEGAVPGDTVTIEDIMKPPGHVRTFRFQDAMGVLNPRFPDIHSTIVTIVDNQLMLDFCVTIPIRPMVGVIGVAPDGELVTTIHPGDPGG